MLLIITILAIIGNLFIGLLVLKKSPKSTINRLLFLANIINACWALSNYLSINPLIGTDPLIWIRLVMFFAVIHASSFVLLITYFPNGISNSKKVYVYAYLVLVAEMLIVTQSPYLFTHLESTPTGLHPVPGVYMPFFGIFTFGSILFAESLLIYKYKKAKGLLKAQLLYILYGAGLMFVLILSTIFIPVVFLQNSSFVAYAPLYTYPFVGALAYIIIRHRFMDVRLIVARSVAYTLVLGFLGSFYVGSVTLVSRYIFSDQIEVSRMLTYILLALFIGFTFQPLRKKLEKYTENIFYKGNYNSNLLVLNLTKIMASTLRLDELTKRTLRELIDTMRITRGAFILFEENNRVKVISDGYETDHSFNKEYLKKLFSFKRILIFEEETDEKILQLMRELNIIVAVPLYGDKQNEGLLVLDSKKSGEVYSEQDIQVLEIFGPEVSVALNNAESYEEISNFNITLKEEISKATTDLRDANAKLEELDKLKDEFVSVASHELRTPMTAIKSYLWMALTGKGGQLTEKQQYYVQRGYNSVDRLIRLVNDMLNISRIESGRVTVEVQSVDLMKLTQEVVDEVMPRADELGVKLVVNAPASLPQVFADSDKIKEVLFNLIGNSLKFTPKDGNITISYLVKDGFIETEIKDTGTGIDADDLGKLFQKFGLLPGSYTTNQVALGTGLGLYICRSIIELHKGKIWASSEGRGKGATFTFSLKEYNEAVAEEMKSLSPSKDKEKVDLIHSQI